MRGGLALRYPEVFGPTWTAGPFDERWASVDISIGFCHTWAIGPVGGSYGASVEITRSCLSHMATGRDA
jgi:hypothetical protein